MPAPLGVGATPERAKRAGITPRACARLCGRIPGNQGPCSTLRRAFLIKSQLLCPLSYAPKCGGDAGGIRTRGFLIDNQALCR